MSNIEPCTRNKEQRIRNEAFSTMKRKYDLQDRLILYSIEILKVVEKLPNNIIGRHFAQQLVRSGTSPAFQHGEAQSAESRRDFVHKLKIGLKELRETYINLTIIGKKPLLGVGEVQDVLRETNELIAIFVKSIQTAKKNIGE